MREGEGFARVLHRSTLLTEEESMTGHIDLFSACLFPALSMLGIHLYA